MKMKKMMLTAVAILVAFVAPAFAANPFADVPMNSWAYDAVAQLAASGVVSGYPDGSFKGAQPATRYELASVVARAMAKIDMEKASKQDVEMLKKLIVEFKDELDALGVKVDKIDARLADIEKGVGKWYFSGNFRFTAFWEGNDQNGTAGNAIYGVDGRSNFNLDRFRWNIKKVVDDKVTLMVRLQSTGGNTGFNGTDTFGVQRAYAIVSLPYDMTAYIGKQAIDWEGTGEWYKTDYDGYNGMFAVMTDMDRMNAFRLAKNWGVGEFELFVAHAEDEGNNWTSYGPTWIDQNKYSKGDYDDAYMFGARAAFRFNEQFKFQLNYIGERYADNEDPYHLRPTGGNFGEWTRPDRFANQSKYNNNTDTFWAAARFDFNQNIGMKAMYYWQSLGWDYLDDFGHLNGSPKLWNIGLDVKQDALKFTSLWIEYAQVDAGFKTGFNSSPYVWYAGGSDMSLLKGAQFAYDTTIWNIFAGQQWNEKWYTYIRWAQFERDMVNANVDGKITNYSASVRYQYTPALSFELMYDYIDIAADNNSDNVIMFRTNINF